ncbi:tRNA (guanine-N(1)-)-methyltransferase [Elysia marginata]|uniref:tRNA (guanine-N(1)-)-methyltransferase n=1 Tax=Elysia marginata TaxID=1093978 RepID=A0AAV4F2M5_9GAST|nr:tRNA (guanine-N(1)-)-methyltransferase [Elysia marginata]
MRIDIITLHPELIKSPFEHSILKRAIDKNIVNVQFHNLRDYTTSKHRNVDDYQYGGGAGMVIAVEPVERCIAHLKSSTYYDEVIFTTPDGDNFNQKTANKLSICNNIIILCGHYKGIDQRVRDHLITKELSIGDYVISGGEMSAVVISDAVIRLLPGVLNDETSALTDSFQDGLLAPPVYTRPANYKGWKVPDILLSGDTPKISKWREKQALKKTKRLRPDLLFS